MKLNRKLFKENRMNRDVKEVISISAEEILRWTSTFISMGVKFILAVYFLNRYSQEKRRVPLVWGLGFFFFGLSQVPLLAIRYFEDINTAMGFALLAAALAALSIALLYYGTSLLYFPMNSFMREKLSIIFFVVMMAIILMFPSIMSPETVLKSVFRVVTTGFLFPILLIMAVIFFMIWKKLEPDNPRKHSVFLVGVALLVYSVLGTYTPTYFGSYFDWIFYSVAALVFLLLLYGMVLGKATGH